MALEQAIAEVRARCRPLRREEVALADAQGRVLAAPVRARRDQPLTDISMMDGYALRAADAPGPLRVVGELAAGDAPWQRALAPGEAARIFTGAPLPPGADSVVMQEHCAREGASVRAEEPVKAGQHIRRRGEELTEGREGVASGTVLGAAELSLAAACGVARLSVYRRPRVAVLVTGNELVPVGTEPPPGKLIETNGVALVALAREAGAQPLALGIAPDDAQTIAARLRQAAAHLLLTPGGAGGRARGHPRAAEGGCS